jgi:CubicO group peptidase (beta-lactamase class C family)
VDTWAASALVNRWIRAKYRFSVNPGAYRVTGWWGSRGVIIRARHVVSVDLWNVCV